MKVCRTCGKELPLESFRRYTRREHPDKDYYRGSCTPCENATERERYDPKKRRAEYERSGLSVAKKYHLSNDPLGELPGRRLSAEDKERKKQARHDYYLRERWYENGCVA